MPDFCEHQNASWSCREERQRDDTKRRREDLKCSFACEQRRSKFQHHHSAKSRRPKKCVDIIYQTFMPEIIAYHEAGHALIAILLGAEVCQVTIEPANDDGPARQGDTQVVWRRSTLSDKAFAERAVQVCLAGPVAEMIYSGDPYHPGLVAEWAADWQDAWQVATLLHTNEQKRVAYLERVSIQLYHQLKSDHLWPALASLADHLLAHETLEGEQVEEIVSVWIA